MGPPLADSRLLIDRADSDLAALETATRLYVASEPYELVLEPNAEAHRLDVVPKFSKLPDPQFSIDFGVIVNHLRSALDYIPAYLANPADPDKSGTQFPIFRTEREYLTPKKGRGLPPRDTMLRGVPKRHWRLFDAQQPYARGDDPDQGPLTILNWATNAHKHRQLQASVIGVDSAHLDFFSDGVHTTTISVANAHFKHNEMLIGVNPEHGTREVKVNYQATTRVAFGRRTISVEALRPVVARVREILEVFEPVVAPGI